ncbi:hypothetical protein Tco_1041243 [Tanacetum coccineum]|uniref:Uncharacterized protein n=1 Tax=Tanacetum coccineum TaxID=301880 RepID=A0ABQ5GFL4_9ASTR
MDTTKAQQKALDDALIAPENRLMIRKYNQRLSSTLKSNSSHVTTLESLAVIINKCLSGKTTGLERLRLLRAQLLWGMYYNKHIDYVYLLWEDLMFQVENKDSKKNNDMFYPRFTKVIVDYFMAKDPSISRRNKMFCHTARDGSMFTTIRSEAYKTYHVYVTGEKTLKPKKKKADSESSPKEKPAQASKGKRIKTPSKVAQSTKKKQPATKSKVKGLIVLSEVALTEAEQMKLATKRSLIQTHSSHASGSGDEVDTLSKVLDEKLQKKTGNDANEESDAHDDSDENESDDEVYTPPDYQLTEESEEQEGDDKVEEGEEEHEDEEMIYEDLNLNRERNNADISSVSDLVSKFINPSTDEGIDSALNQNIQSNALIDIPVTATTETPLTMTTNFQLPFPNIHLLQQTPNLSTSTTFPTTNSLEIPNFASLFGFEQRISSLKIELSELKQTNKFVETVSSIPGIVDNYLDSKMKEAIDVAVQLKSNKLREEAQAENQDFINSIDSNMNKIIKEQVKAQTSKIMSKFEKYVTETLGAKVLVRSTNQPQMSYAVASSLSKLELKKILMDIMEENKSIDISKSQFREATVMKNPLLDQTEGQREGDQARKPSQPINQLIRRAGQQVLLQTVSDLPPQPWITHLAQAAGLQSSFDELMATPIDFSAFMMNRLKIDYLTQELLTGPTYDLMKGSCKSVAELEYHLEEVFKAINDQLDWNNPEGTPYPHDLSKPLPLIPNARGRLVIPFDHFINNDLEYLKGGSLSHKYTTSITKTKAADYGQIKWIEDRIPRSMWSTVPVVYDKHAYWGTYHWGPKRQRFYGYATNMETSKDVYSKHRIIAVISLKIMKFYGYSHLEEITVRRQDDKLYKFREGDFKRLRRQDIEDMLLLLVQGKLTNLSLDERYALNVALRMYTRRIVIQERVEDLQLAVESYQKKINLSRPDSQRSDLRKMTPYTAYPDIQGIIYQDDMNRNRLMRTDELHKFSDGTLNHVRTALNDIATTPNPPPTTLGIPRWSTCRRDDGLIKTREELE